MVPGAREAGPADIVPELELLLLEAVPVDTVPELELPPPEAVPVDTVPELELPPPEVVPVGVVPELESLPVPGFGSPPPHPVRTIAQPSTHIDPMRLMEAPRTQ